MADPKPLTLGAMGLGASPIRRKRSLKLDLLGLNIS
jgi:hypothetical protein